jgi:hypothetical protein
MVVWTALLAHGESSANLRRDCSIDLRTAVWVEDASVRLSDLLPPGEPEAIRMAGASIRLGTSPLPGSTRTIDKELLIERLAEYPALLRRTCLPERIFVRRGGRPIPPQAVQNAISDFLRARGVNPAQFHASPLAAGATQIRTLGRNPAIEVTGSRWDPRQQSLEFRLRCHARSGCGSFLVKMRMPERPSGALLRRLSSLGAAASSALPPAVAAHVAEPQPSLEQAGDAAILVVASGGIRISLPVICLQRGALRETIRVRAANGHRVFHAEIMGSGLLRAAF